MKERKMFKPLNKRVIVKMLDMTTKTGIVIAGENKESIVAGQVLASGTDQVKEGDVVIFPKGQAAKFSYKGQEHIIVREEALLGVEPKA
jgi:chaperonin GroES